MYKKLFQNTFYLYVLQFSIYFFAFITVPYQTRVLGPEVFGTLAFASAIMIYLQLLIDFGFMLYATGQVAKARDDSRQISKIFSAVTIIKLIMSGLALLLMTLAFRLFPKYFGDYWLFLIFTIGTVLGGLIPDYIYRGLEETKYVAIRTFLVKLFFTLLVFAFLKTHQDYLAVPILNGLGNLLALAWAVHHLKRQFGVEFKLRLASKSFIYQTFIKSSKFFLSRIATTIYGASNTLVLRAIYGTSPIMGYFTSSDRLINTGKSALSPIADSVYPHMIKHRDFKLIRRILVITTPVTLLIALVCFVFAEPICVILFGRDFAGAAAVLRAFCPMIVTTLPMYLMGFPVLGSLGLSDYANKSIMYGLVVHIGVVAVLFITGTISAVSLAISASISETFILIARVIFFYKHKGVVNENAQINS